MGKIWRVFAVCGRRNGDTCQDTWSGLKNVVGWWLWDCIKWYMESAYSVGDVIPDLAVKHLLDHVTWFGVCDSLTRMLQQN